MPEAVTLNQAFIAGAGVLRQAGMATPELDARLLLCHAAGLSHEAYIGNGRQALRPEAAAELDAAIARRLMREPVSRIVGMREFYGRVFLVDRHTLDPRPDTETLIEAALAHVDRAGLRHAPLKLLDLGAGTGCILITLLSELPRAEGVGIDRSPEALALAAVNAERLGVAARARFFTSDWLDAVEGRFDLIVANPPYLAESELGTLAEEVLLYDPILALCGGKDGLDAYRRIAAGADRVLADKGRLLLEIGPSQADPATEILQEAGLALDAIKHDLAGRPRVVIWGRRGSSRTAPKNHLESRDVQARFDLRRRLFGCSALEARGRLQRQRERIL
jgi:release factor glutamine methyltransferase